MQSVSNSNAETFWSFRFGSVGDVVLGLARSRLAKAGELFLRMYFGSRKSCLCTLTALGVSGRGNA
jgi:hypothetical protein